MSLEIIYENDEVLAVNKPAGIVVHPDGKTVEETLVDLILKEHPEIKGVGEPLELKDGTVIDRPGIVHRLDRETSGVILIAKNQESYLNLKKQFQGREIEKTYHAFVYGNIKEDDGVVDRPIGKSKKDFRQWSAGRGARGEMRPAETFFKVLDRGKDEGESYTFLEVKPKTGRTHQIRVHMKAISHPVVCDKLYAQKRPCLLGFKRLALHARNISFKDLSGELHEVVAPYPPDFLSISS